MFLDCLTATSIWSVAVAVLYTYDCGGDYCL